MNVNSGKIEKSIIYANITARYGKKNLKKVLAKNQDLSLFSNDIILLCMGNLLCYHFHSGDTDFYENCNRF
jgi:hypothetical protein